MPLGEFVERFIFRAVGIYSYQKAGCNRFHASKWRNCNISNRTSFKALKKIKNDISGVNPSHLARIQPKSLVTLIVEHLTLKMREVYTVPTVIQNAYQFPEAVEETVNRITKCGFSYFTNRESYDEVPENMVSLEAMVKVPRPPEETWNSRRRARFTKMGKRILEGK